MKTYSIRKTDTNEVCTCAISQRSRYDFRGTTPRWIVETCEGLEVIDEEYFKTRKAAQFYIDMVEKDHKIVSDEDRMKVSYYVSKIV